MAKYRLATYCTFAGSDTYHEIEGDFDTIDEAIAAFGGHDAAYDQALDDISPEYDFQEVEE